MEALDDFLHRSSIRGLMHENAGKGHSQHFSNRIGFWTWWLSILRMQLHTNMLCKMRKVYEWLNQKWLGIHFLFLSKNDINSVLKIPVANFCRSITPQTYPGHGRCVASSNFNCVWFVDANCPESSPKYFWNCVIGFQLYSKITRCALKAVSPAPKLDLEF